MLRWFKQNAEIKRIGHDIYERIVAQARAVPFYRDCGVPDTIEGRFEMVLIHLILVLERLKREGALGQRVGQRVLETLIADMDDAMRQIGIGDMGVPKRVQRVAAAVIERSKAYGLSEMPPFGTQSNQPDSLETALLEHVFSAGPASGRTDRPHDAPRLAAYVQGARTALSAASRDDLMTARFAFPDIGH
jgi:cytochrome b pre-mRNA-processing protein 3